MRPMEISVRTLSVNMLSKGTCAPSAMPKRCQRHSLLSSRAHLAYPTLHFLDKMRPVSLQQRYKFSGGSCGGGPVHSGFQLKGRPHRKQSRSQSWPVPPGHVRSQPEEDVSILCVCAKQLRPSCSPHMAFQNSESRAWRIVSQEFGRV